MEKYCNKRRTTHSALKFWNASTDAGFVDADGPRCPLVSVDEHILQHAGCRQTGGVIVGWCGRPIDRHTRSHIVAFTNTAICRL